MLKLKKKKKDDKPEHTPEHSGGVTWGPVSAILVVIIVYLAAQLLAVVILSIYPAFRHWSYNEAQNWLSSSNYAEFFLTVIVEGLTLAFIAIFLKLRKTNFKALGLKGYPRLVDLGYVLVGFGAYFITYLIFFTSIEHLVPSLNVNLKQDIGFNTGTTGNQLWLVFISLVILPPIVEEILFRGFLYTGLRSKLNKIAAALITSVFFASLHLIEGSGGILWIGGLDTFILSMVLVYLREKTDRLWASMGLHMVKNFIAFASLFLFHVS